MTDDKVWDCRIDWKRCRDRLVEEQVCERSSPAPQPKQLELFPPNIALTPPAVSAPVSPPAFERNERILTPADPRWAAFVRALNKAGSKLGCRHDHRLAKRIMAHMGGIDITGSIAFFEDHGGFCDCEILLNVDWNASLTVDSLQVGN
jgi:hypothetical protein